MSNKKVINALLTKLYNDPKTGLIGADKLFQKAKQLYGSITLKQVRDWYKDNIQRFGYKSHQYDQFKIVSHNPNSWQIDLAFVREGLQRSPVGSSIPSKILFTAININSRIGYARLLPNKNADSVLKALKDLISIHPVDVLTSDNGKEFLNRTIQRFVKDKKIEHFNNEAGDHATLGKIERFNRTIKQRLMRIRAGVPLTQTLLNNLIANYNDTEHSAIKATPNEMQGGVDERAIEHNQDLAQKLIRDFSQGDTVRYRLKKTQFGKETFTWSETVYEVVDIDGYRVEIRSKNGHTLYKSPNELKKVNATPTDAVIESNQIWEAEKILEHKKLRNGKFKYLVKWKGYPIDEATWENQDNLRLINKNQMSTLEKKYFNST